MTKIRSDNYSTVLKASIELFAERGFDNTTTRDIAKQAGVSEGTVFNLVGKKEEILQTIIGNGWEELLKICRRIRGADAIEILMDVFSYVWDYFLVEQPSIGKIIIFEIRKQSKELVQLVATDQMSQFSRFLESIVKQGQEEGVFQQDLNVAAARQALIGIVDEALYETMRVKMGGQEVIERKTKEGRLYKKDDVRRMYRSFLDGIMTEEGRRSKKFILPEEGETCPQKTVQIVVTKHSWTEVRLAGKEYIIISEDDMLSITNCPEQEDKNTIRNKTSLILKDSL